MHNYKGDPMQIGKNQLADMMAENGPRLLGSQMEGLSDSVGLGMNLGAGVGSGSAGFLALTGGCPSSSPDGDSSSSSGSSSSSKSSEDDSSDASEEPPAAAPSIVEELSSLRRVPSGSPTKASGKAGSGARSSGANNVSAYKEITVPANGMEFVVAKKRFEAVVQTTLDSFKV